MENDDATLQGAEALTESVPVGAFEQLFYYFQDGGPVLYVLLAISILGLTIILAKLFQFFVLRLSARGVAAQAIEFWRAGRTGEALGCLEGKRNPVARVVHVALSGRTKEGVSEETVKEEVTRVAGLELDSLRSGLRLLALIANLSPLIGLLGTVLGMIRAFQALEAAGSRVDPSILSAGIWIALLTTAAGLIVAIPAAAAHNWMEGVVYRSQRAMEDAVTRVFTADIESKPLRATPAVPGSPAAEPAA